MPSGSSYLFASADLTDVLQAHEAQIQSRVNSIPKDQILSVSDEELVNHLVAELSVEPLEFHEDHAEVEPAETQIDVTQSWERNPFGEELVVVPGNTVTISIPFSGDIQLWSLRFSPVQGVFPTGSVSPSGESQGFLYIMAQQPVDENPQNIKANIDRELQEIRICLAHQREKIVQFMADWSR